MRSYNVFEVIRDDYKPVENLYTTEQYVGDDLDAQLRKTPEELIQELLGESTK